MRGIFRQALLWTLFWLGVSALVAFNVLLAWVAAAPRSLARALPYIEAQLAPPGSPYSVGIRQGMLLWDGWRRPIDIRLRGVAVRGKDGALLASFPDVSLGIDLFALAIGRVEPTSLVLHHPALYLLRDKNGAYRFVPEAEGNVPQVPQDETTLSPEALQALLSGDKSVALLRKLKKVEVDDALLAVEDADGRRLLQAQHVHVLLKRSAFAVSLEVETHIPQALREAYCTLNATLERGKNPSLSGTAAFQALYPATVAPLLASTQAEYLQELDIPLSGRVTFHQQAGRTDEKFTLEGGPGTLSPAMLEKPVSVQRVHAEGAAKGLQDIMIRQALIDLNGPRVEGKNLHLHLVQAGLGIDGEVTVSSVPAARVGEFWPSSLSPEARAWVTGNITAGKVTEAKAEFHVPPGDFALPALPEKDLDASFAFTGAEVRYLPRQPPVANAEGLIRLTGKSLAVDIASASAFSETRISAGHVAIDDLNAANPLVSVQLAATAPARDVVEFLSLPPVERAQALRLDKTGVSGNVSAKANLTFHFYAPRDAKGRPDPNLGMDYHVQADVQHISAPGFLGRFDVMDAAGALEADNAGVHFSGSGSVNGAQASQAEIAYRYQPKDGYDTEITAHAHAPASVLPRFNVSLPGKISGPLSIALHYRSGSKNEEVSADINAQAASIGLAELNWQKPPGQAARLSIAAHEEPDHLVIDRLALDAEDGKARGSAVLSRNGDTLQSLKMDTLKIAGDDLSLEYALIPGGYRITAHGRRADASYWLDQPGNGFTFTGLPALQLDLDLGELALGKNRALQQVKGMVDCGKDICRAVSLDGSAGSAPFSMRIAAGAKGRALELKAGKAGEFLKALGIYDNMLGGVLTLQGTFDDAASGHKLHGTLDISRHVIEHAPFLARLLSLASLGGLLDSLRGQGITFDHLFVPFTLEGNVITVKDAKTHGPAMGLSADGTIRFPGEILDLRGTVVPSYTINHVLSHVPLLGGALTGGGEGVFGARYHISGKADNPDVSVNPLSLLTPGFLRGVFGIFDRKPEDRTE